MFTIAKTKITISYDSEKLDAIKQFSPDDAELISLVLEEAVDKIYTRAVPSAVRKYIDARSAKKTKPKKSDSESDSVKR